MSTSFRKILLCLCAILATSAVASASASAVLPCHAPHGDTPELTACLENGEEPAKLAGTSTESILEAKVLGLKVKIICSQDTFASTASETEDSKGTATITFEKCKVVEPKNCKLPKAEEEKIVANANSQLGPSGVREVTFTGSGTGEKFTEITLENKGTETCSIKNKYPITGNTGTGCTWDEKIETTFELLHTLTCTKAGEKLKLGGNEATFSSVAKVHTSPTESKWAIRAS